MLRPDFRFRSVPQAGLSGPLETGQGGDKQLGPFSKNSLRLLKLKGAEIKSGQGEAGAKAVAALGSADLLWALADTSPSSLACRALMD